ncbi:MAG: hypothetical protein JO099_03390 [Acidobacteriia bacterium]|nr:hypothetical protein [Terriglobia bacterium]
MPILKKIRWTAAARPVTVIAAIPGLLCLAQPGRRLESPADRSLVTIVHVRPEMSGEWMELQKSAVVPTLKKAGMKTRTVYSSGIFGEAFTYMLILPMTGFTEFDSAEKQAQALGLVADPKLAERLRRCVVSTSSFLSTALPDISNAGETRSAPIIGFLRLRIAPGKMEEYVSLYKTEVLPLLIKADSKVFVASRRLGTDGYDLTFETPMMRFSDLDAPPPLVRAFGPETIAKTLAKLNPLATVMENGILIRQAELSF